MGLAVALLGREDVDVDGMASEPRRPGISLEKYFDTSPGCSSFRRLVVCREGDGLELLDEPALPSRPSTWRGPPFVNRLLYGFEPNPCIGHDRSLGSNLGQDQREGVRKDVLFLGHGLALGHASICRKAIQLYVRTDRVVIQ